MHYATSEQQYTVCHFRSASVPPLQCKFGNSVIYKAAIVSYSHDYEL